MFDSLDTMQPDALMALIKAFRADDRDGKIDLGVGVYRTADGRTPVFGAIKKAEARLLESQDSKAYIGPEGDPDFVAALMPVIFGDDRPADRLTGVQTPGGTGALRMAAELMRRVGVTRIFVGQPSWANHAPVMKAAGLEVAIFRHADLDSQTADLDAALTAIAGAGATDAILLHGCCHNPTGIDYDADEWDAIAGALGRSAALPLIDIAYQGLGRGFDEDAAGLRAVVASAPQALIAYSCDKNFGVYRERVGALYGLAGDGDTAAKVNSHMASLARANWSMPPDHGAAAVRIALEDDELAREWRAEVDEMRDRLNAVRAALAAHDEVGKVDLAAVGRQNGMFSTLKVTPEQVERLRADHAIYMVGSGRINVAGFTLPEVDRFVSALREVA
jgi:aromatic-amino-acid transaminase